MLKNVYSVPHDSVNCADIENRVKDYDVIVENSAIALGNDKGKAIAAEPLLKYLYDNKDADFITELVKYPLHILTSILAISQEISGWAPHRIESKNNETKYKKYLSTITASNLFVTNKKSCSKVEYNLSNYKKLLNNVTNLYPYISKEEHQEIYSSLKGMAERSLTKVNQANSTILFTHTVLSSRDGTIEVYLYSSKIAFSYDNKKAKVEPNTKFGASLDVSRLDLNFMDFKLLPSDVKKIVEINFTPFLAWLKRNKQKVDVDEKNGIRILKNTLK